MSPLRSRESAGIDHRGADQAGDAATGRARAEHRDALLGERHAGDVDGREQGAGRDRRRALNVVVEGAEPIAIALEQARRVVLGESLPTAAARAASASTTAETKASMKSSYS